MWLAASHALMATRATRMTTGMVPMSPAPSVPWITLLAWSALRLERVSGRSKCSTATSAAGGRKSFVDWIGSLPTATTIDVVNMSLGAPGSDSTCSGNDALHNAICRVVDAGVPVVVAAGNDSEDAASTVPAAYDEVITVSALADSDGRLGRGVPRHRLDRTIPWRSFSNFGADIDIAAPGVNILSTVLGGYARGSGTSVASPHVAGAAALYLADNRGRLPRRSRPIS